MSSFLNKVELKKQLKSLGIKIEGNYVRKRDIEKLILANDKTLVIDLSTYKHGKLQKKYDSGLDECPYCNSDNIANEGPEDHVGNEEQLDVTCHDCGNHWVEVYRGNKCIEIILYDIKGDYVFE